MTMGAPISTDPIERGKQLGRTFFAWALISSWLMIGGILAFVFLHTIWFLIAAIGLTFVLRYFVMFRKFKKGADGQH